MACSDRYGNARQFLATFSPSKITEYCKEQNLERIYTGTAPTIGTVADTYGDDTADLWIGNMVHALANYSSTKVKLRQDQYHDLAAIIRIKYRHLKVTEFMHFIFQFMGGEYDKFYGVVDTLAITDALRRFNEERETILARLYQQHQAIARAIYDAAHDREARRFADFLLRHHLTHSEFFRISMTADLTLDEMEDLFWLYRLGYDNECYSPVTPEVILIQSLIQSNHATRH